MTTDYGTAFPNSRKVYVTGRAGDIAGDGADAGDRARRR